MNFIVKSKFKFEQRKEDWPTNSFKTIVNSVQNVKLPQMELLVKSCFVTCNFCNGRSPSGLRHGEL